MERTYFQPTGLRSALAVLAKHPEVRIVAGGTDLVVGARSGKLSMPFGLMAIDRLRGMNSIRKTRDGGLGLGALVTHSDLVASTAVRRTWSALSDASALVGSPATRHMGTVGGNVCNASPAMELGSPLLVFEAAVELASSRGVRTMPFGSFMEGPGKTGRQPDEVLKSVVLPPPPAPGRTGTAYVRLEYRQAMEIAIVGAAALVTLDGDARCTAARIALTAVAPTCVRAPAAEQLLIGQALDAGVIDRAAAAALEVAKPIDDVRASAEYRRAMVPVIVTRAITIAWERALKGVTR
jgi:CO/xanthine dehydrogenase FAD-binding subunit